MVVIPIKHSYCEKFLIEFGGKYWVQYFVAEILKKFEPPGSRLHKFAA